MMYEHLDTLDLDMSPTRPPVPMEKVTRIKAKQIQRSLGTRVAAGYLRNRGIGLAICLLWLAGSTRELRGTM